MLFENIKGKVAEETVSNTKEWVRIEVPPGQYTATVSAIASRKASVKKSVAVIKPGEHTKLDIALPM